MGEFCGCFNIKHGNVKLMDSIAYQWIHGNFRILMDIPYIYICMYIYIYTYICHGQNMLD